MLPQPRNHDISVDPTTGGLTIRAVDLVLPVKGGSIVFARVHDSLRNLDAFHGCLFPFHERLVPDADGSVRHILPDGSELRFVPNGDGTYSPSASFNHEALQRHGDGSWSVAFPSLSRSVFHPDGSLRQTLDPHGNAVTYTWHDPEHLYGHPATITDPSGRVIRMEQDDSDPENRKWTFTDWAGRTWRYTWTAAFSLKTYTDPEGHTTTYESTEYSLSSATLSGIKGIHLPDGTCFMRADAVGGSPLSTKVGSLTFANGLRVEYRYDWANRRTTIDEGGRVSTVEYDDAFNITRTTDALGNTWHFEYDGDHNPTYVVDPRLATRSYTYDSRGNVLTETDALGNTWTHAYDPVVDRLSRTVAPAPFLSETTFRHDPATGDLLSVTDPGGGVTRYGYRPDGLLERVTDPSGSSVEFEYDGFGNLVRMVDGMGRATTLEHDALGNPVRIVDPLARTTRQWYDRLGRVVEMTDPVGSRMRVGYDVRGNQTRLEGPQGRPVTFTYGPMDELLGTRDASGHEVSFRYDGFLRLTGMVNANGQAWSYDYDALDRPTRETDPLGHSTTWAYDPYCNTTIRTDANGWRTRVFKDLMCRVSRVESHDGSFVDFAYDALSRPVRMTRPGRRYGEAVLGTARFGTEPDEAVTYTHDARGLLTSVVHPSEWGPRTIGFAYDDAGRLASLTDIDGVATTYVHDAGGAVTRATRAGQTVSYGMDAAGRVTTMVLPNGVVGTTTYDAAGGVSRLEYRNGSGACLLAVDYESDRAGNRTRRSVSREPWARYGDHVLGRSPYGPGEPRVDRYAYDATGRLVAGSLDGGYGYDANGNRVMETGRGSVLQSTYDVADQQLSSGSTAFEWTLRGDLASRRDERGTTSYRFNYSGHLEGVGFPDGTASVFRYLEPSGLLETATGRTGETTRFFWTPGGLPSVLNEVDASGSTRASHFLVGSRLVGTVGPTGAGRWFLTDALGSVLAVTDDAGNLTDTLDYDPWGNLRGSDPHDAPGCMPHRFVGALGVRWDQDTGLHYMRNRWYDAGQGRFISRDPVKTTPNGTLRNNLYNYTEGNPANAIDPSGEDRIDWDSLADRLKNVIVPGPYGMPEARDWGAWADLPEYSERAGGRTAGILCEGSAWVGVGAAVTSVGLYSYTAYKSAAVLRGIPFSYHALEQMEARRVPISAVQYAYKFGNTTGGTYSAQRLSVPGVTIVINRTTGMVITVWGKGKQP